MAIARALVVGPRVILATSRREPRHRDRADVIDMLAGLATSHDTTIVATRDSELAARGAEKACDR